MSETKPTKFAVGQRWTILRDVSDGCYVVAEVDADGRAVIDWVSPTETCRQSGKFRIDDNYLTYLGLSSPTPAPVSPPKIDWGEACARLSGQASGPAPVSVRGMEADEHGYPVRCFGCGGEKNGQNYTCHRCHCTMKTDYWMELQRDWCNGARDFPRPTSPQPSPVACGHIKRGDILNRQCILPAGHDGDHRDPPSPVAPMVCGRKGMLWMGGRWKPCPGCAECPSPVAPTKEQQILYRTMRAFYGTPAAIYGRAVGEMRALDGSPKTALEAIQARKKPDPWRPSCDEDFWIPDAGT